MNRLWNLPAWLELSEAAEYLHAITKQEIKINEVTILEAALEGQVQLSIRFSLPVFAYEVPEQPTSTDGFEYEDLLGVYDLVLEGSVRDEIEYLCAVEQGRPHKELVVHEGARVKSEGRVYQLSPSHAPVSALLGGVLGLTREELGDFSTVIRQRASSKGGAQQTDIRPVKKQERETFLKVIVALAVPVAKYLTSHPREKNAANWPQAEETLTDLSDALGERVDRETFRAIIAALMKYKQPDLSKPYTAAKTLNDRLVDLGLQARSRETIVTVLKSIKDARKTPLV